MAKTTATKPAPKAAKIAEPKLDAKLINSLQELGINATTESEARATLNKLMSENGVEDSENDSLTDLIAMAAVFVNSGDAAAADADTEEEEVVTAAPAKGKGGKSPKAKAEEAEMDELAEEVVTTGKGKAAAKSATKPAAKKKASSDGGRRKLLGKRWEDLNEAERNKALVPFVKRLPAKQFKIDQLQRSFTVKFIGQSSEQNIFKYHLLRLLENGQLEGIFVTHRFKTPDEFSEFLDEEIIKTRTLKKGDSCSYIHPLRQDEVFELLDNTEFLKQSIAAAAKQDTKMKNNREKLEEELETGTATKGKAPVKSTPAPVKGKTKAKVEVEEPEAEAEVEEEEVVVPAKKVLAKAPAITKADVAAAKTAIKGQVTSKVLPKPAPAKATGKKK